MSAKGKYQEFDPLTPEEFAALERSILDRGVDVPIFLDEVGTVLDGHHRLAICKKHGITDYPTIVKASLSEEEKRNLAQSLNMARRSLTRDQKQRQIRNRLKRNPDHSDRLIVQTLGVDHKTVGRVRGEMEAGGEVPHVEQKVGLDGVRYKMAERRKSTDAEGGEIPQRLESIFACASEHTTLANLITDIKRRATALANRSPLFGRLNALQRHLASAEAVLKETSPHVIHRPCGGEGCDKCGGKGYLVVGEIPQRNGRSE